ncbi:VOC family protein [Pseudooceanicola sp. C21-150M6]|uniref:VOC family protein n=1 Tax=Pseudooceanicola sp. C21-150M6 TaxID=3434355 RepID=UPI003D7FD8B7
MTADPDPTPDEQKAHSHVRGVEHIGITVPDHDAALAFFQDAFGAEILFSHTDTAGGPIHGRDVGAKNGLPADRAMAKVSMLRLKNGPNIEIFEIDRPEGQPGTDIVFLGISHFSVNVSDIGRAAEAFRAAGGTMLSSPYDLGPPERAEGNRGVFGRAPWGLLIEMEQLPGPMDYASGARSTRWQPDGG